MDKEYTIKLANYYCHLKSKNGPYTNTHLVYLNSFLYICHGWKLAVMKKPLLEEKIKADKRLPRIESLYDFFLTKQSVQNIKYASSYGHDINSDDKLIFDKVFEVYGKFTGPQLLYAILNGKDSAWAIAINENYNYVQDKDIRQQFINKAKRNAELDNFEGIDEEDEEYDHVLV